jgi:hypothetical protein
VNPTGSIMDAAAVAAIGAMVSTLTQVTKRSLPGDWDRFGPLIAALISAAGVALWVYSAPTFPPARTDVWTIGAGWVAVFSSAVGIYEVVKMATNIVARTPDRSPLPDPPPARRRRRTVPAPPEAVLTAPVVSTPQPRRRAGQMPEMTS